MEVGKDTVKALLPKFGFTVEDIPEADGKRADLLVSDATSKYLIEVKDKEEGEDQARTRIETLSRGDLYEQADLLAVNTRLSNLLKGARKQLDATPKEDGTFQVIWFQATGIDADLKYRQAFATFYGKVDLVAKYPRQEDTVPCWYFDYATAYEMQTVDALVLCDNKQLQVCLNEFSVRATEFRASSLCQTFLELDGVIDPVRLAAEGKIISCRFDVPRKNDDDIAKALQEQTGVLYSPIRLTRHAASVATGPPRPQKPM